MLARVGVLHFRIFAVELTPIFSYQTTIVPASLARSSSRLLLLLAGCAESSAPLQKLRLERVRAVAIADDLSRTGLVALDEQGSIVLWDGDACTLTLMPSSATTRRLVTRCGEGPSELSWPAALVVSGDQVAAISGSGRVLRWAGDTLDSFVPQRQVDRLWLTASGLFGRRMGTNELVRISSSPEVAPPHALPAGCALCPLSLSSHGVFATVAGDSAGTISVGRIGQDSHRSIVITDVPPEQPGADDMADYEAELRHAERVIRERTGAVVQLGSQRAAPFRLQRFSATPPWVDLDGGLWAILRRASPQGDQLAYTPAAGRAPGGWLQLPAGSRIAAAAGKFILVRARDVADSLVLFRLSFEEPSGK